MKYHNMAFHFPSIMFSLVRCSGSHQVFTFQGSPRDSFKEHDWAEVADLPPGARRALPS